MAIDGHDVASVNDLHRVLDRYESGDTVRVTLARFEKGDYSKSDVKVTLKPLPAN